MGCKKLTYWNEVEIRLRRDYEKPALPLRVLPENDQVTVIVVYSIRYDNAKVVQRWFTPDPAEQFANPHLAMGYNPVMYVDPDGEFVWMIPNIGYSRDGGLSFGLSLVVGIPGVASAQAGIGYSPGSNDAYAYLGATVLMNTVSASYSTTGDFSVGYSVGATPFSGLPISTNLFSAGMNYNITQDSWSGNVSSWQVDQNGWRYNPSVSAMIMPEHSTNFVRKGKFISNDKMLSKFVDARNYQGALDYFGFKGDYSPDSDAFKGENAGAIGATNPNTRQRLFNSSAFESFDLLFAVSMKENRASRNVRQGKIKNNFDVDNEEYAGFKHVYRNQGLYHKHGQPLERGINYYGNLINQPQFQSQWWHFIYRMPRVY